MINFTTFKRIMEAYKKIRRVLSVPIIVSTAFTVIYSESLISGTKECIEVSHCHHECEDFNATESHEHCVLTCLKTQCEENLYAQGVVLRSCVIVQCVVIFLFLFVEMVLVYNTNEKKHMFGTSHNR